MSAIKLIKADGSTRARIKDLFLFKDNPKTVQDEDYQRLVAQLELGEHSPLLITTDGEVLGGNTRLRAYKELGHETAKVVVVEIVKEDGAVSIVVDGFKSLRTFDTVKQAKIELALSHNDGVGVYDQEKLAELMVVNKVDSVIYSVPTKIETVDSVIQKVSPGDEPEPEQEEEEEPRKKHEVECPSCGEIIPLESRGVQVEG